MRKGSFIVEALMWVASLVFAIMAGYLFHTLFPDRLTTFLSVPEDIRPMASVVIVALWAVNFLVIVAWTTIRREWHSSAFALFLGGIPFYMTSLGYFKPWAFTWFAFFAVLAVIYLDGHMSRAGENRRIAHRRRLRPLKRR